MERSAGRSEGFGPSVPSKKILCSSSMRFDRPDRDKRGVTPRIEETPGPDGQGQDSGSVGARGSTRAGAWGEITPLPSDPANSAKYDVPCLREMETEEGVDSKPIRWLQDDEGGPPRQNIVRWLYGVLRTSGEENNIDPGALGVTGRAGSARLQNQPGRGIRGTAWRHAGRRGNAGRSPGGIAGTQD